MSNAREVIRITGGKGLILSSGSPLGEIGVRGPLDVVNLGTMLGMPANLAKDAVSLNPKKVLLNARQLPSSLWLQADGQKHGEHSRPSSPHQS